MCYNKDHLISVEETEKQEFTFRAKAYMDEGLGKVRVTRDVQLTP